MRKSQFSIALVAPYIVLLKGQLGAVDFDSGHGSKPILHLHLFIYF